MKQNNFKHIAVIGIKGLPSKGGGERVAEAIINKAVKKGFKVSVYAKKNYSEKDELPTHVNMILIKDFKGKHLSAFSFGFFSALHALLYGKYDIVHLHYADFGFLVPLLRLRFKVIGTSHGAEYNRKKWGKFAKLCFKLFEKLFVKFANECTSVSKSLADYYKQKYKKKILYIPNGIDVHKKLDEKKDFFKEIGLEKNNYILFAAGRIIPTKGLEFLLQANKFLELKIPIVIAGRIENDLKYKLELDELKRDNIQYIGFLNDKKVLFNLISNTKFFIFPSTYEAMSIALLEVAMLGKCIICSDIIENINAIEDNALYFKSADYIDLSKKIVYALENSYKIDLIGKKAKEWVMLHRNNDIINNRYIKLYQNLLQN